MKVIKLGEKLINRWEQPEYKPTIILYWARDRRSFVCS